MDVDKLFWESMMENPGRVALLARLPAGNWEASIQPSEDGEVGLFLRYTGPKINGLNVDRKGA